MDKTEETLSIIKPDAIERNLEEKIKNKFIENSFEIIQQKKVKLEKKRCRTILQNSRDKTFL